MRLIEKIKLRECLPSGMLYYRDEELGNEFNSIDLFMERIGYPREIFTHTTDEIIEHDFMLHFFLVIILKDKR